MTDWIEHTTDTCPVDPETVVEVRLRGVYVRPADKAGDIDWGSFLKASGRPPLGSPILHPLDVTHYRIITPAPTPPLFLGGDPAKPPEPEMVKPDWTNFIMSDGRAARYRVTAVGPNGAVPPTDDAPEVTFKYPLLEDPEPERDDWIEHQPPRTHDGGPCPCPGFLIVETWGQASGAALVLGARYQKTKGEAKLQSWESVKYWRPADPGWECRFERDRLVAYRKKEATE